MLDSLCSSPKKLLQNLKKEQLSLSSFEHTQITTANKKKHKAAMDLADALLTTKQRKIAIKGELSTNNAKQHFMEIDVWDKKATAAFEGQSKVGSRRKAN